jgi:hypothetical protein
MEKGLTNPDSLKRFFRGNRSEPPTYVLIEWLFIRLLGLIYLIAFVSLAVQITGLVSSGGILPVGEYLRAVQERLGASGYWQVPTLFWLNSSDTVLKLACVLGALLALVLIAGYARRPVLIALFILYLSLAGAAQVFLAYQWDSLLLETGFLAIFLGDSPLMIWLFRWLLFRLMFMSGALKLLSGDPTWRSLTALNYHYQTQPLPTPIAWYANQLPEAFQKLSVLVVFFIELVVPFFIFGPRRLRRLAALAIAFLQILIFLTGNYTFFNLLTIALCVFLLEDATLRRWFPGSLVRRASASASARDAPKVGRWVAVGVAGMIILISGFQLFGFLGGALPRPAERALVWLSPFRVVNTYGLFAVMTTTRPEIIIEGSNDRQTWLAYEFKYKPGDVKRPPTWVAPHQPRLDWQMWFAALGAFDADRLMVNLMTRLQQGSPDVLALLGKNPFPGAPPRYVRAEVYHYQFTDFATLRAEGAWWRRELVGVYVPAVPLESR